MSVQVKYAKLLSKGKVKSLDINRVFNVLAVSAESNGTLLFDIAPDFKPIQ